MALGYSIYLTGTIVRVRKASILGSESQPPLLPEFLRAIVSRLAVVWVKKRIRNPRANGTIEFQEVPPNPVND